MAEYIEREKAFKLIKEQKEKETGAYSKGRNKGLIIAGSIINNKEGLPTVDVEEVVRCKDCKFRKEDKEFMTGHYCYLRNANGGKFCCDNDFCSYGERKTT